jgi:hypothetical protein
MYTWVHALVFCVIGVVASKLIVLVERNPEIGFGSFLFFCFFQFGFIIAAFIFAEPVLYILAWPNILGGEFAGGGDDGRLLLAASSEAGHPTVD